MRLGYERYLSQREFFQTIYYLGSKLDILIHSRRELEGRAAGGEWVGILNDQGGGNYFEVIYWGRSAATIYEGTYFSRKKSSTPCGGRSEKLPTTTFFFFFSHVRVNLEQKSWSLSSQG